VILPIYWLTWFLARSAFWLFWRYRVIGLENLPREGPYILAANHRSNAEPAILGCTPPRRNYFFAKRELFDRPLFGRYIRALGAFPVDRGNADLKFGAPEALFRMPEQPTPFGAFDFAGFAVAPDGERLLLHRSPDSERDSDSLILVQNWYELIEESSR
jgi:1-acyl-sn-glycerol-3-phosphate acyltransferase